MVRAVFAGFAGDVPKFAGVVVDDKIGVATQFFVLPTLNVTRKILIKDFPQCNVLCLADFEKLVKPKQTCSVRNILSDKDWKVLKGVEDFYNETKCFECAVMEFQFPGVYEKVEKAFLSTKNPCKHLKSLYVRVENIFMTYTDML
jgi:hypothetical protein